MARILQFNFEDKLAQYADRVTGADIVGLAAELHCDTVVIFARDAWGRAYYDSAVARKVASLKSRDLLREVVEEAHRRGIKVVAMIGHTTNPELYSSHPEWAQRDRNGRVIHMDTDPQGVKDKVRWPLMCLNSPFLDYVLREAEEVLRYGVDGVFLDSFRYMPDVERACFCENCRKAYAEEVGGELPSEEDWDSEAFRRAFAWRYRVNVKALERVKDFVRKAKPGAFLVYNSHPAGWRGRANTIVEMSRNAVDVVFAEGSEADYQPPGFLAEIVKLSKAMGAKRVWATRNSFHMALTTTTTSPVVVRQGIREIFAAGGEPMLLVFSSAFVQSPKGLKAAAQAFREVEALEEYMEGAERLRYAGVVYSNRSRDWLGRSDPRHVTDEARGLYYALAYSGYPVDFVSDTQLDSGELKGYRVLLLGSVASMSRRGVASLAERAARGLGVVATYLTSTMDEDGRQLEEFQLSELLGVSYKGVLELPWSYVLPHGEHPVTEGLQGEAILWGDYDRVFNGRRVPPSIAWHARVKALEGTSVLGYVGEPAGEYGYEYENGRSPPLLGSPTGAPAITAREEPRVVYFSGQLGRLFWRTGLPQHEALILNAARWAGGEPPLKLESEGLVLVEPYTRSGQLVVHLVNLTYDRRIIVRGNTADPDAWHSTSESVMPPRRVVPVEAHLRLRGFAPKKAYSPLTSKKYEVETKGEEVAIRVPLEEYEVLVLDL
ncbi:alpha-amylase family protein [Thermofilum pendens]|uniref:Beta-galactosidase trimerisation domain-containing protein n=1 Tax=Thermofilum pendens (strain DSM 2475 / Hrk 5) TaxID=368408 RepID=A1S0G8_THEPD|nr:alpha-amylase family protein [Thermofilum pendens]ABL78948.1 protein of unknown function DUF187 [Thermofilum pendens Hrk 5]